MGGPPRPEEGWVRDAVDEQEDYLKRVRSCGGVTGRPHQFEDFGRPSPDGTIMGALMWRECLACGAAASAADYATRRQARR